MKTAIITGASSGLGREFALHISAAFPEIEQVWLIARRKDRLEFLITKIPGKTKAVPLDLCSDEDLAVLEKKVSDECPEIEVLVNCAGCGFLSNVADCDAELLRRMADLNVKATTLVTRICLPYMTVGGHIINISSISSFCPNPRMTVYSATKAYITAFSLGLREELRNRKISVTAVCPGPMSTEFPDVGGITGNSQAFQLLPHCEPRKIAKKSYKAAKADKAVYTPTMIYKAYRVAAKLVPLRVLVKFTGV